MSSDSSSKQFSALEAARSEYLARSVAEETLDAELPIVDCHHHLWDIRGITDPRFGGKSHRYLIDEFAADIDSGHNIEASIFVECVSMYRQRGPIEMRPVGEVDFVSGIAAMSESGHFGPTHIAAAIVGHADLSLGERVRTVLEAQVMAGNGRFRGIRHSAGWSEDSTVRNNSHARPGLYLEPQFNLGMQQLRSLRLTFDAMVFHPQLNDVLMLARLHPEVTVVLGHCGAPLGSGQYAGQKEEVFAVWRRAMRDLAACKNVRVKLGGMTIRLAAYDFRALNRPPTSTELAILWGRYITECIELFGASRCMFESNFPVEKMGVSYATLWNTFKRITASATASERAALFSLTARQTYGLRAVENKGNA